jgi:hypothetical protein
VTAQELEDRLEDEAELESAREFISDEASETTRRVMTDGGVEDDDFAGAILEAGNSEEIDSYDQVQTATERIEELSDTEMAMEVVERTPGPAIRFLAEVNE